MSRNQRILEWRTKAVLVCAVGLCLSLRVTASAESQGGIATNAAKMSFRLGVKVLMRDGVNLDATVYRVDAPSRATPCVFVLLPYISQVYYNVATYFASRGLTFVAVDSRGRGNSEGVFRPFIQEANDGYDVVEWLAGQPYCNGKVGMWGGSYMGYAQWATAKERPPHLATIVPVAASYPGVDFPRTHNIFFSHSVRWLTLLGGRTEQEQLSGDDAYWRGRFADWFVSGRPFKDLALIAGNPSATFQEWLSHPDQDEYWDAYTPTAKQYTELSIPILTITGAYDGDQAGALTYYREFMKHARAPERSSHFLVIGPWDHDGTRRPKHTVAGLELGPHARLDVKRLHLEWYAWTMQDGPKPEFLQRPVAYYVMGADKWRYAQTLEEVTGSAVPYYVDSPGGNPSDVFASGTLSTALARARAPDSIVYDPHDLSTVPVERTVDPDAILDQRMVFARQGRELVYHSAPFPKDTEISGFFRFSAWLSIDRADTDLAVAVYEIRPDGSSIVLTSDLMRARYRESWRTARLIDTRQPLLYDMKGFTFTSRRVGKGSRLRLVVSPVNSIYSEKNYNSGADVSSESMQDAQIVTIRLYHDASHPTALFVPLGQPEFATEPAAPESAFMATDAAF